MAPWADGQEPAPANGVEDKSAVWQHIEATYWKAAEAVRIREDAQLDQDFKASIAPTLKQNLELYDERTRLVERLQQIDRLIHTHDAELRQAHSGLEQRKAELEKRRAMEDEAKRTAFKQQRLAGQPHASSPPMDAQQMAARMALPCGLSQPAMPMNGHRHNGTDVGRPSTVNGEALPSRTHSPRHEGQAAGASHDDFWTRHPREPRNGDPVLIDLTDSPQPAVRADRADATHATNGADAAPPQAATYPSALATSKDFKGQDKMGIEVYDGSGYLVGEVYSLRLNNPWIRIIKAVPVKRQVHMRSGRRFTAETLERIYQLADPEMKDAWLALVIQATGEVQANPCAECLYNNGVFSECVMMDDRHMFKRCSNCEWDDSVCHKTPRQPGPGQHREAAIARASTPVAPVHESVEQAPPAPVAPAAGGFKAVNASAFTAVNTAAKRMEGHEEPRQGRRNDRKSLPGHFPGPSDWDAHHSGAETAPQVKKGRKSLPTTRNPSAAPVEGEEAKTQTPSRPRGPRKKKEPNPEDAEDAEAIEAAKQERWKALQLDTINKDTLLLKDDGTIFTEPEIMRGVPLEKISPEHPYWDPTWPLIEDLTKPQLEKWVLKYQRHVDDKKLPQSSKFLAGRQVNRGKQVLEFLEKGNLHPYQIVGRKWINKGLANYDVVYRLVGILADLEKYNIDMEPHQWLRMRLHEIYMEKGDDFNLSKTVADLYHDPKIQGIRERSGHGSIGRPSGYNMIKKDGKSDGAKKTPRGKKRKELHPTPAGSPQGPGSEIGQEHEQEQEQEHAPAPRQAPEPKQAPQPEDEPSPTLTADEEKEGEDGQEEEQEEEHEEEQEEEPEEDEEEEPEETGPVTRSRPSSAQGPSNGVKTRRALAGSAPHHDSPPATQQKQQKKELSQQPTNNSQVPTDEDFAYDGYTSTDSYSNDTVLRVDYRVYQVKNKVGTTNKRVTQYWHWIADQGRFEHQVLSNVKRNAKTKTSSASWGVYREPYEFHLRLEEVVDVTWASGALKVLITTKKIEGKEERGDVLVSFKRERTKRRFLAFMRKKKIKLVKTNQSVSFP